MLNRNVGSFAVAKAVSLLLLIFCGYLLADWQGIMPSERIDRIVPKVQYSKLSNCNISICNKIYIQNKFPGKDIVSAKAAELLAEQFRYFGVEPSIIENSDEKSVDGNFVICLVKASALSKSKDASASALSNPEGYSLVIDDKRAVITASTSRGLLYGVQSLRQLMQSPSKAKVVLPTGKFLDWPEMKWRAYFSTATLKGKKNYEAACRLLDTLSLLKYNAVVLRVDQFLKYPSNPELGHVRASVTADVYKKFVEYGKSLGLEMIPCLSSYSHFGWVFWAPKYRHLMTVPQGQISHFSIPDVNNPEYAKLIREIMEDIIEIFQPKYFHVGLDELQHAPRLDDKKFHAEVKANYLKAVTILHKICKDNNVRMMMWADMLDPLGAGGPPDNISELLPRKIPKDIILIYWRYYAKSIDEFTTLDWWQDNGFDVLACGWFDLYNIETHMKKYQSLKKKHLGFMGTSWGGTTYTIETPELDASMVVGADESWSIFDPALPKMDVFPTNVFYRLSGFNWRKMLYHYQTVDLKPYAKWTLSGDGEKKNNFFRTKEKDFTSLKPGVYQYADVVGVVADAENNAIVLGRRGDKDFPREIPNINVKQQADAVVFMHTSSMPSRKTTSFSNLDNRSRFDPNVLAEYIIHYADGSKVVIPIKYTREITDWNEPMGAAFAPVLWRGKTVDGAMAIICGYRWENPHPEKIISSISLNGGKGILRILVTSITLMKK